MRFNPFIQRDANFSDLERFMMKELKLRVKSVQKEIVKSISQNSLEGIQSMAPDEFGGYEKDLVNSKIKSDTIGYGVIYKAKSEKAGTKDRLTTLLFIRKIRRRTGKWADVLRTLEEYGPFTLDTWPVKVPRDKAVVVYRQASPFSVKKVKERNMRQFDDIRVKLGKSGIRLKKSDFKINLSKMDIIEDLAFRVIRRERGIGGVTANPHWKPGIEKSRSEENLKKIEINKDIQKTLSDPNFRNWKRLGKVTDFVSLNDLKDIEQFQKLIISEVKNG